VGRRQEAIVTDTLETKKPGAIETKKPGAELPKARRLHRRWPGLIWALPLAALIIVGWLGLDALLERGIDVVVTFEQAAGVTPGDTKVIVQGVVAGHVTHVRIAEDGQHVDVTLRLDPHESAALNTATQFWLIGAKPSFTDLSSLTAAVAGLSIGMSPQQGGTPTTHFVGLQEPPAIPPGTKGTRYYLRTTNLGSVAKGASILYRGQEIGKVMSAKLLELNSFRIEIFIYDPYDQFVRKGAEFWAGSPFALTIGDGGLQAKLASANVLQGIVQFDLPDAAHDAPRSPKDTTFLLFDSQAAAVQGDLGPPITYQIAFKGTAGDLADGAKVMLLGVKIGEVRGVKLVLPESDPPSTVATIVIFPAQLNVDRSESTEPDAWRRASDEALVKLLAQGYRATLVQSPPLIGSRSIVLALDTQARGGALITDGGGYPRIPSAGTTGDADQLMSQANDILAKINQVPIAEIGQQVAGFTAHLDQITASPEIKDAIVHLDNTLRQVDRTIGPLVARLNSTVEQLGGAATAARGVLGGPGANQDESLAEAIRQIDQTARSLRALTDYLGRHPEALIGGKAKEAR
jgi:paraquat-inducible protein B